MKAIRREELLDLAIDWLVDCVCMNISAVGPSQDGLPQIDKHHVRQIADGYYDHRILEINEHSEAISVAVAICTAFYEPRAGSLAAAWLSDEDTIEEIFMDMDTATLSILIGVAAAAAVIAVAWVIRRGQSVRLRTRIELKPSDEFATLRRIAESNAPGADIAAQLVENATEPWNWELFPSMSDLHASERHRLLEGYAAIGAGNVKAIRPKAGDAFNAIFMSTDYPITDDDFWVVTVDPANDQVGFSVANRVVMTAQVEVCTADWWVLSKPDCPVGRIIATEPDELIPGGRMGAVGWRAPWGFTHPEDLRVRLGFDERTLDTWRTRMATDINTFYKGRSDRCLAITGLAGEFFESSTMEDPKGEPTGDAVVVEIVKREGVPQHGLACIGGSPLLLAVVNTKPAWAKS